MGIEMVSIFLSLVAILVAIIIPIIIYKLQNKEKIIFESESVFSNNPCLIFKEKDKNIIFEIRNIGKIKTTISDVFIRIEKTKYQIKDSLNLEIDAGQTKTFSINKNTLLEHIESLKQYHNSNSIVYWVFKTINNEYVIKTRILDEYIFCEYRQEKMEKEYTLGIILQQTGYVKEILKLKITGEKLQQYLKRNDFFLQKLFQPKTFNVSIFDKNEVIEYLEETGISYDDEEITDGYIFYY